MNPATSPDPDPERSVPSTRTWVTWTLIAINTLVFLAMCASGVGVMSPNAAMTLDWGSNFGPQTLSGQWWRLFTSVFVHFGLFHLLLNMITLYQVGRLTERLYGSARLLGLYLFAGVTGSLASIFWHPGVNSAGASGAIFGVFGGLLVYMLKYRQHLPGAKRQLSSILILIGYNLFYGFSQQGIDNGAHLGGLAGGLLLGLSLARPPGEPTGSPSSRRSALLSWALALLVLGAATTRLVSVREGYQQQLRFESALQALGPSSTQANQQGVALLRSPADTQARREDSKRKIAEQVLPQWQALYASFSAATLPDGSSWSPLRQAILEYLDDNRKLYRLAIVLIDQGDHPNAETEAQFVAVTQDLVAHTALIKRLAPVKQ